MSTFELRTQVAKVDDGLGIVFGYAIVCKEGGEPYFDSQGDHIPEDSMLQAAVDFMQHSRAAKAMHDGEAIGDAWVFPLTEDIAKALEIETKRTGLLIAMKPDADTLKAYKSGKYTGFSIGGVRVQDEDVPE